MRPSARLLATAATTTNHGLRPALALLPPIPLYRRLFRAHRNHLPSSMRLMGDEYIKSEFRKHKDVDNPVHLVSTCGLESYGSAPPLRVPQAKTWLQIGFLTEWQLYAQKIEGDTWKGEKIEQEK